MLSICAIKQENCVHPNEATNATYIALNSQMLLNQQSLSEVKHKLFNLFKCKLKKDLIKINYEWEKLQYFNKGICICTVAQDATYSTCKMVLHTCRCRTTTFAVAVVPDYTS